MLAEPAMSELSRTISIICRLLPDFAGMLYAKAAPRVNDSGAFSLRADRRFPRYGDTD